jgi:hypothetical protein
MFQRDINNMKTKTKTFIYISKSIKNDPIKWQSFQNCLNEVAIKYPQFKYSEPICEAYDKANKDDILIHRSNLSAKETQEILRTLKQCISKHIDLK